MSYAAPMNDETKTLSRKAQALSPNERVALVEDVLDSLDRLDPAIEQLWAKEAADRLAAYRRGELSAKDLSDIAAKYRA
jgi:putative addiction module component (TIGR02574 family)